MSPTASCPLCDRQWLLVYPVRYALACPRGAARAPALAGNFRIDTRAPQSVATARHTLRALRPGYLYTYDEKRRRLCGYMVFEDGFLWRFPPGPLSLHPEDEDELTRGCVVNGELKFETLGRCVDIEHRPGDEATNWWFGWSNVSWTRALIAKIHDPDWRRRHMQRIDVPAMLAGGAPHTGEFQAAHHRIAHFAMNEQAMADAFGFSNRDPHREAHQGRRDLAKRIGDTMAASPIKKGFVVALNDPIGMANDLAELTVPNVHNGFDEEMYWKSVSAELLKSAELGVRAQARESTRTSYAVSDEIRKLQSSPGLAASGAGGEVTDMGLLYRLLKGFFKTGSLKKAMDDDERRAANVPAALREAEDAAWLDVSTRIDEKGKRVSVLDLGALERFPREYEQAFEAFQPTLDRLARAHADWLDSPLLADWMLGNTDREDLRSGYAYSESCAQAIGAGAGTGACKAVLQKWLDQPRMADTRNLFARALVFSQDDLMQAADAKIHGSDIQFESFMNLYKGALQKLERDPSAIALRDRLILTAANVIVDTLVKTGMSAAKNLVMLRLHLQAGVAIKFDQVSKIDLRNWILTQAREGGIDLEGGRTEQRRAATRVARDVIRKASAPNSHTVAIRMDIAALQRMGNLEAGAIEGVQIPGVATLKKWLGSSAPAVFNLGVATAVIQLATLAFAARDWAQSDEFGEDENGRKFWACVAAIFGNLLETISGTVKVAAEHPHPLSSVILKHWARARGLVKGGKYLGRALSSIAGAALAWMDISKGMMEAMSNGERTLARFYLLSGALNFYLAVFSLAEFIPLFWPVLVASIVVAAGIAMLRKSDLARWVSHCKFSKSGHYSSLNAELSAFASLIEA